MKTESDAKQSNPAAESGRRVPGPGVVGPGTCRGADVDDGHRHHLKLSINLSRQWEAPQDRHNRSH